MTSTGGGGTGDVQISVSTSGGGSTTGTQILAGDGSGGFQNVSLTGLSYNNTTHVLSTSNNGNVVGPALGATNGNVALYDGTTGKLIKDGPAPSITIAGTSTALGGSITQDTITGLSSNGIVKHSGTNTLAIAAGGTDYSAGTSALATGIVKSTTSTGALSIAAASDISSTLGSQTANTVYAGPSTGSAANPTFRSLVSTDIPALSYVASSGGTATNLTLAGTLKDSNSSSAGTSGQVLSSTATGTKWITPSSGGNVTGTGTSTSGNFAAFNNGSATAINDTGYSPSSFVSATTVESPHYVLAGPNSGSTAAAPTFRAIVASDVPTLNQSTTGSAATLTTGRTIAITGDLGYTSPAFNGSANVTATGTLATITTAAGPIGSSTVTPVITIDAKGRVTALSSATIATGGLPSGFQGQVLLEGPSSTPGFYYQSYNVTAFSSLSAAISAAGSTGVLYFPTAYTIPSGTTISIPIIVEGLLTCSGTATFNGTIHAPLKQIFSGGTVTIGSNTPYIYPEWFGTYKNNSNDDSVAINLALKAVYIDPSPSATPRPGSGASTNAVFLTGTYYINNPIYLCYNASGSQCGSIFKIAGGAQINALSGYTGDGIIYKYNSANTISDVPSLNGFNGSSAAALTILGCSVMQLNCFAIYNSNIAVKIKSVSPVGTPTGGILDNIVRVQFISNCVYGYYTTSDGYNIAIQGNEFYTNFFSSGITNGIYACYFDNQTNGAWNGNLYNFKAIDLNRSQSSYGFYNANTTSPVINCILTCDQWFGGIDFNAQPWISGTTYPNSYGNQVGDTTSTTLSLNASPIGVGSISANNTYTIVSLGSTTTGQWNSIGASGTPYVGQVFFATGSTSGSGTVSPAPAIGGSYTIASLGSTTTAQWNSIGAVGTPYVGQVFNCVGTTSGTGTVYSNYIYQLIPGSLTSTTAPHADPTNWTNTGSFWQDSIPSCSFVKGLFTGCEFRFYMQGHLDFLLWNNFVMTGTNNRVIYTNGGGNYNIWPAAGQPGSAVGVSTTSGRPSAPGSPYFYNRITCKYNITSSISANGLLTLYVYIPITDGFLSGGQTSASNNFSCLPYPNGTGTPIGLVFESAVDNNAVNPNEVILYFRNVSGGTINSGSGFFDFIFTCGL